MPRTFSTAIDEKMKTSKHKLRRPEKEIVVQEVSSRPHSGCEEITVAYLFGSFVTEQSFSDIDLGIITNVEPDAPTLPFIIDFFP